MHKLTSVFLVVCLLGGACVAHAQDDTRYPAHVTTDAQKEAWRTGWPQLHGADCNGTTPDLGYELIEKIEDMRLLWKSEAFVPPASHYGIRSGFATPVVADGRVYIYYTWPSNLSPDVSQVAREDARGLDTGRRDRTDRSDKPGNDVVVCIDALTGKTLWQRVFEGQGETLLGSGKGGGHGTMCIHDGKAYAFGMAGWIYCLDAETGKTIWSGHKQPSAHSPNGTPFVAEGVLVYRNGQTLIGYDAETGEKLWTHGGVVKGNRSSSCTRVWAHGDREYFIHENICLDPKTGKQLWSIGPIEGGNTTAIYKDFMVCREADKESDTVGPRCYKISSEGAELLWQFETDKGSFLMKGFSSPSFYEGYALIDMQAPKKDKTGRKPRLFAMVDLETGKAIETEGRYKAWKYQPIVAEGKYFFFSNPTWGFSIWNVEPDNLKLLDEKKMRGGGWAGDTSAAYVCGLLYIRKNNRVACFDLRKR